LSGGSGSDRRRAAGRAGRAPGRCPRQFSVLAADRLGASVELVEMLVGSLRDHDRGLAVGVVGVGGVERLVLGVSLACVQVDAVAAVVAMHCLFDLALAK
jgi:hypothetical protein